MLADQVVDPAVSRAKFDRELARFRALEDQYLKRGWWLLKAEFPRALIAFVTKAIRPPSVVFSALIDFTNYDLWPPSVLIVDPFTRVPYRRNELPTAMPRMVKTPQLMLAPDGRTQQVEVAQPQPLLQASNPTDVPFLCLPGVREYHDHPAHSGDSWLLHRGRGEGTLHFIIEQLSKYGLDPVRSLDTKIRVEVTGFRVSAELPT